MKTLMQVRKERGVTQRAVADYLGVSRHTYRRYESEQEKMTVGQAKAVCNFLHCDVADIFLPDEGK